MNLFYFRFCCEAQLYVILDMNQQGKYILKWGKSVFFDLSIFYLQGKVQAQKSKKAPKPAPVESSEEDSDDDDDDDVEVRAQAFSRCMQNEP